MIDARSVLARLRDKAPLSNSELTWFANGLASGDVSDAQAGAFAMAVLLNGFDTRQRVGLTQAMRDSGEVLHWDLPGPVWDKHSTGGVGDSPSLILAPALAACGLYNPMISGRGLGHTGGTLDKLEAIAGLKTDVSEAHFRDMVREIGCAIVSATAEIAPADKRLYAVRDVTATVESIDLITASILSKKLAAGLDGLVLDVKTGSGAFMKTLTQSRALAQALVSTANGAGCITSALITDMSQPLASALGNALEIAAVMEVMCEGATGSRLAQLTLALGGECLAQAGLEADAEAGAARLKRAIESGAAAERFGAMVAALGGPSDFLENWRAELPEAPIVRDVKARRGGTVRRMDGEALGLCVVHLGGGRAVQTDVIDPAVGLSHMVELGAVVAPGDTLARLHAGDGAAADAAQAAVLAAIEIGAGPVDLPPLIYERIS